MPDRGARLRPALGPGLFPHPDVEPARLGARRVRARDGDPDAAVGRRPAARRRAGGSLRRRAGAQRRRAPLRARPRRHGLFAHAGAAASHRRHGDRLRACRLLLHHRDRRIRPADAAAMAHARLRRRHRGRLVRAVPVLAAHRRAHRPLRLAGHAADLRRRRALDHAAVAGARLAARRGGAGGRGRSAAVGGAGAQRSLRPPFLRAAW